MTSINLEPYTHFALQVAERAGELIVKLRSQGGLKVAEKAERNLVSSADREAERLIISMIRANYPSHHILSEESLHAVQPQQLFSGLWWIVDPIDGTVNYLNGHHQVAVSIALAMEGEVKVGVVHAPFQAETFRAERGGGAYLNERPIRVSSESNLKRALVATGFPYDRANTQELALRVQRILAECQDVRRLGAASLDICWVACSRLHGYFESVNPWDIAAAALIAKEAGAKVAQLGEPEAELPLDLRSRNLLVSTPQHFEALKRLFSG